MKSTIITSLGLLALQALAAPAEKRQAKKSLADVLMNERIDALIDRTGGRWSENLRNHDLILTFF
jgi:hypothetical protein